MSSDSFTPFETPVALCLGGLDPSAGAGVLRDAMTLAALGVHPMVIPLAETIQNGVGCTYIEAPCASPLLRLESLRPHLRGTWGLKMGMSDLDAMTLRPLCRSLAEMEPVVKIWDPIQAPTCGVGLHDASRLRRMAEVLLASGDWVIAPNLFEAAALANIPLSEATKVEVLELAAPLLAMGAKAVWLKGGHGAGDHVEDHWMSRDGLISLGQYPRLDGDRRGTGCTLASAWLAFSLRGMDGVTAARSAVHWLREHWPHAFIPGEVGRPCFAPVHV